MGTLSVTQPRENDRTTYVRQFTFNKVGEYNSRRDGAIVSGTPLSGTPISEFPVGIKIMLPEGNQIKYMTYIQNGNPDTGKYASSCDGAWLWTNVWDESTFGTDVSYADSPIQEKIEEAFTLLPSALKSHVKDVKIPYRVGSTGRTIYNLENGLSQKGFLLSATELGASIDPNQGIVIGTKLPYFDLTNSTSQKRVNYKNDGTPYVYWSRSPMNSSSSNQIFSINSSGVIDGTTALSNNIRGCPVCFIFDYDVLISTEVNSDGSYNFSV